MLKLALQGELLFSVYLQATDICLVQICDQMIDIILKRICLLCHFCFNFQSQPYMI